MASVLQLASTCTECGEVRLHLKCVLEKFGFVGLFPHNYSEVDHPPETSATVMNAWSHPPRRGAYIKTGIPLSLPLP